MKDVFENVSWGEMNFTKLVNMLIDFIYSIIKVEFPTIGEIVK